KRLIALLGFIDDELNPGGTRRVAAQADPKASDVARVRIGLLVPAGCLVQIEGDPRTPIGFGPRKLTGHAIVALHVGVTALTGRIAIADRVVRTLNPKGVGVCADVPIGVDVWAVVDDRPSVVRIENRLELGDTQINGSGCLCAGSQNLN